MKVRYNTIIHSVRKNLDLSLNEYCILDTINMLSGHNSPVPGWCVKSQGNLADDLGLARKTVSRLEKKLEEKGFIERGNGSIKRCSKKWLDAVLNHESQGGTKCPNGRDKMSQGVGQNVPDGRDKMSQGVGQNVPDGRDKMSHKNNIENNTKNDIKKYNPLSPFENNFIVDPFQNERFKEIWIQWLDYKKSEHRFKYKNEKTHQLALHKLHRDTDGDVDFAIESIATAMSSGWKGVFPKKTNSNGQNSGKQLSTEDIAKGADW